MLYALAKWLAVQHPNFHVFTYQTLRGILAVASALLLSLLVGPWMIERLSRYQIGQQVRTDGPQTHLKKKGTPTMGGALIIVAIAISTLLWADLANRYVWIVLGVTIAFGLVGFYDDYLKLVVGNSKGLIARWKYLLAVDRRPGRGARAVLHRAHAGRDDAVPAAVQGLRAAARRSRLHRARLPDDRRHEQRGEPHRRARRPRDHAVGDGRRRRSACSRMRAATRSSPTTWGSRGARRRRADDLLRRHLAARASASCGSTRTRRRCSWATSARSRSARRSV